LKRHFSRKIKHPGNFLKKAEAVLAFNLQTWKEEFSQRIKRLKERGNYLASGSIYGTVAASTLWPLVVASQTGDPIAAGMALGTVLSNVGSNLVADHLKRWTEEAEAVEEIQVEAERNPQFRAEIDAILEKFDAFNAAIAELKTKDHSWFAEILREELQKLGNADNFIRVEKRGIFIKGDVNKSIIITGDKTKVTYKY
jgi:hypothetical protein